MREGKTRIVLRPEGGTGTLYIPAGVVKDSSFPFRPNQKVLVRIRGHKLIVEKEELFEKEKIMLGARKREV